MSHIFYCKCASCINVYAKFDESLCDIIRCKGKKQNCYRQTEKWTMYNNILPHTHFLKLYFVWGEGVKKGK